MPRPDSVAGGLYTQPVRRICTLAVALGFLAGCGSAGSGHTITGSIVILAVGRGRGGVSGGDSVTIKNEQGTVIGRGGLTSTTTGESACSYSFKVPDVADSKFYGISVGRLDAVQYSQADMTKNNWNVSLSVT